MATPLEPDILEYELKQATGNIANNKAREGDGIPAELFEILKMMLLKCWTQYVSKFEEFSCGHRSVFIPIPKKGNATECANYCTLALISHTRRVMLNILSS